MNFFEVFRLLDLSVDLIYIVVGFITLLILFIVLYFLFIFKQKTIHNDEALKKDFTSNKFNQLKNEYEQEVLKIKKEYKNR